MAAKNTLKSVAQALQQLELIQEVIWCVRDIAEELQSDEGVRAYLHQLDSVVDFVRGELHTVSGECVSHSDLERRRLAWKRAVGRSETPGEEPRTIRNPWTKTPKTAGEAESFEAAAQEIPVEELEEDFDAS